VSWVAVDDAGQIVGFALASAIERGRHYAEHEVIELHYAGVVPEHRGRGVFTELVGRVLARLAPVMTTVSPHNRSDAARRFAKLGFRETRAAGGELRLRWEP
jgi:GNAT superfamily N-acetyltransferase